MTKKFTHSYFPKKMKYFTPIAFAGGIYLFTMQQPVWCALLMTLGVLMKMGVRLGFHIKYVLTIPQYSLNI